MDESGPLTSAQCSTPLLNSAILPQLPTDLTETVAEDPSSRFVCEDDVNSSYNSGRVTNKLFS